MRVNAIEYIDLIEEKINIKEITLYAQNFCSSRLIGESQSMIETLKHFVLFTCILKEKS